MGQSIGNMTNAISSWIDTNLSDKDPETRLWHRIGKIGEEHGEVIEALIGATRGNPRKPDSHTMADVQKELLDVALCALAAWSHTTGNKGDSLSALRHHAIFIRNRAGLKP